MKFIKKLFGQKSESDSSNTSIIEQAVEIYFRNFQDPEMIFEKIEDLTNNKTHSLMLYLFIPHIFCRMILPEIEYPQVYIVTNEKGEDEFRNFDDTPIFNEMVTVINKNWDKYASMDPMKILFHSGDFRAANDMLKQGSELENLKAVPPRITEIKA